MTILAKSTEHGFTRVQTMDTVTDIASWQAVVSQGRPILSVSAITNAAVSALAPHLYPTKSVLRALEVRSA